MLVKNTIGRPFSTLGEVPLIAAIAAAELASHNPSRLPNSTADGNLCRETSSIMVVRDKRDVFIDLSGEISLINSNVFPRNLHSNVPMVV